MSNYKYTEDMVARMQSVCADGATEEKIEALMAEFSFPRRSVTAKLRSLNVDVPSKVEAPKFNEEETAAFTEFLTSHSGQLTAVEIASQFMGGKFNDKQVRGKALAAELTEHIKPAEKAVKPRTYTPEEEATITSMASAGKFLEEIAEALGKSVNSLRGKALSMELKIPQKNKKEATKGGSYPKLAELAPTMTVEELAEHYSKDGVVKTTRGVKTALSRNNVAAKNYTPKKAA